MPEFSAPSSHPPLGLIAGEGIFPKLVARGAKAAGRQVVCAAFSGSADPDLAAECDRFKWVGVVRLGQWIRFLKKSGCHEAIMVGRVAKRKLFSRWKYLQNVPDLRTLRLWLSELRRDRRDQAILFAVIRELEREGITLIDSTRFCADQLCTEGVMTSRAPTPAQWEDVRFGWELCQNLSRLDIGQAIALKDKTVLAVEALEGTNAMIQRAGEMCRGGNWTLIKVSNVRQDMRVDVPTVGVRTIEHLHAAGAGCLVLEAGKTILLEKEKVLEAAERLKIAIIGCVRPPDAHNSAAS
ncbi:MAG TPA: UDP-2,3-diacylglucosamine diphosphatase LpxI [Tepidisphaeraceae bacterium]|nr:UDP-2,3-diacylglucosamine diphosphatase LpxI [Tepidisphaeraceae bacterium]